VGVRSGGLCGSVRLARAGAAGRQAGMEAASLPGFPLYRLPNLPSAISLPPRPVCSVRAGWRRKGAWPRADCLPAQE
jgi:hypothetical protein